MQLRQGGVTDVDVLTALERTPREKFVPEVFAERAYENSALPIGEGQTISQPLVVGIMTQALELGKRHKVLEIGMGSGYQTAILAQLCRRVYSIERIRPLYVAASARLAELNARNVTAKIADGSKGWPEQAPFDRIIVTAAAPELIPDLTDQLAPEGVMVVPVGEDGAEQTLLRIRNGPQGLKEEKLTGVRFVPLLGGVVN
jgi:protein-L-isoaspartate(D-aspartate) O-methyltransferase